MSAPPRPPFHASCTSDLADIPVRPSLSFRYVKIEVIATSMNFNVRFDNLRAVALTSAPLQDPPALSFPGRWSSLSDDDKSMLLKIDAVSHQTLRDCMQVRTSHALRPQLLAFEPLAEISFLLDRLRRWPSS